MQLKASFVLAVGFFLSAGSVYNGPAIGAEQQPEPAAIQTQSVNVTDYDTVSLNVQNTDLAQVLQLLSIQGKRNIVPSPKVQGSVTANLYDVTFHEALDAILQQNGCGFKEKGNFIYVYTVEELRTIDAAERKPAYKVVKLNYITAADASTFVTPLLSSAGSIAISGSVSAGFQPSLSDGGANSYAHEDTMVIRDYPENIEEIQKVIKTLDTRPMQILVEATVLQAKVMEDNQFGVDFSILSNIAVDAFMNPLNAVTDLIAGTVTPSHNAGAITSGVGNVAGQKGGLKVGLVTNNVAAFIRALDSVTDTTVVANPKLLALNRQKADVLVGQRVGYLSTTATSTATTQTVEFLDTGTQLTVRPFASSDGYIRLELRPQVSTASIREASGVTIPDEITQELTTNVMVRDGQTVVLGGLFKEETTITREQTPFLGDIPVAGAAFQGRTDTVERNEVIFLVTPHIVRDKALYASGEATKDGIEMIRFGARQGLLPWSRSKMSAAHLRDALKAMETDDRDAALYEVDLALGMEPRDTEAIRLKERLTGERAYWPGRSLMNDAVDMMVEQTTGYNRRDVRSVPMLPDPTPSKIQVIPGGQVGNAAGDTPEQTAAQQPEIDLTPVSVDLSDLGPAEDGSAQWWEQTDDDEFMAENNGFEEAQTEETAAELTEVAPSEQVSGGIDPESQLTEPAAQPLVEQTEEQAEEQPADEVAQEVAEEAVDESTEQIAEPPQDDDGAEVEDVTEPNFDADPVAEVADEQDAEARGFTDLLRAAMQKFDEATEVEADLTESAEGSVDEGQAQADASEDTEAPEDATTSVEVDQTEEGK